MKIKSVALLGAGAVGAYIIWGLSEVKTENGGNRMNTNDFYELKKSYDTSQMPEKEVIKMKEKMNQAKAEKKNKHNKTIITRIWVGEIGRAHV